ncbi:30S ribosomal protein S4 [Erysipelothrix amsterdamensis]|uniref:Small ribosomal subunit protein uS4 n=2 Tax=Erysipelothrix TaxID=1647 RepID=A0A3Q8S329_9FIRM|nr:MULTISPECIES: 30S ribosomal protein S4 [Erysipelothrix]CAH2761701.1 30S ribosomal protein S4 [Erysipelothrix sp. A18Y020d]AYV34907.1 30S ribosomal protein S4 [Erysipelothrix rhusiopathiae]AZK44555.1 30S ribosomal protein S4 [Erysipelothrix piscisicarius]MBK2401851.1 30S ribosomal protein S4 [Erysipelothrix sp. strain 2 (EsS2-6-Brazil)]MBK2404009.1 30S ribosomal protein S4 [Erysipelothrix sp. strain 2 (EsS2-7-Brazil)]
MARIKGPVWKKARRLSFSILETGEELQRRDYAPGQHGKARRPKLSNYGLQLREKQRIRYTYGVTEKQFYNTFKKASKLEGVAGHNFLFMLESRLDNVVYRMNLSRTRRGARQLVNHGHILVDGKKVDIPSYIVKPGQTIEVKESSRSMAAIKDALEANVSMVDYVTFDKDKFKGEYKRLPERSELNQEINEALVVEFYNR